MLEPVASIRKFRCSSTSKVECLVNLFLYRSADKASLYQAIMEVFIESKDLFVFQLRAEQVFDALRRNSSFELPARAEVDAALVQLCGWGNLDTYPDTANVGSVEDFYHQRQTLEMTAQGEAAHRALASFDAAAACKGKLQPSRVADIRLLLQELKQLSREEEPDTWKVHRNLLALQALVEDLSATAQTFVRVSERRIGLPPSEARSLAEYGQGFIGELVLDADNICEAIRDIESAGFERLLQAVADRSVRDLSHWRWHWERLRRWFVSQPDSPSTSERLRERARTSIPALLSVITRFNDQQIHRIDRSNDFRVLARWFAQAASDAEAHMLWRAAFGLCSARHLIIDDETLTDRESQAVPATTSWLHAPPLRLSMDPSDRLSESRTGGLSRMIDRSAEKEKLAAASHEESQSLLNARRGFGSGNRIRLSDLKQMETAEFDLFLGLLGEAVSGRFFPAEAVEISSGDGCLTVKLEPTDDGRDAVIVTSDGTFAGPDHWISIEQVSAADVVEVAT
jgi:uncharacterized protein (TIGR02677 family)